MKKLLKISLCIMAVAVGARSASAQNVDDILQQIKKVNNSKQIRYRYAVYLVNTASNQKTDSITGMLYKNSYNYIDSNSASNILFNGKFFCKLDHSQKTAEVYDVSVLKSKLGMSFDEGGGTTIAVPDSIVARYARSNVQILPDGNFRVQLVFSNQALLKAEFIVERNTWLVKNVLIETKDTDGGGDNFIRVYSMADITYSVPMYRFNQDNYFKVAGDKIQLNKRYSKYSLKTLINHS